MKSFVLAFASIFVFACGSSFTSGEMGGAAGSGAPDASAGAAGSAGEGVGGGTSSGAAGSSSVGGSNPTAGSSGSAGSTSAGGSAGVGGASGSGGRAGAAGSSGSPIDAGRDTGTSDAGATPCKLDSDCKLVDTCCLGCIAKGTDFPVPPCAQQCLVDPCSGPGVKGVRCFQGTCALANECDPTTVGCDSLPPPCPAGELPSISGGCWSGHCVKASSCRTVKDCTACDAQSYICARTETQLGNSFRCVDIPAACAMSRTCTCEGPFACMSPYTTCSENGGGTQLTCSCPNC